MTAPVVARLFAEDGSAGRPAARGASCGLRCQSWAEASRFVRRLAGQDELFGANTTIGAFLAGRSSRPTRKYNTRTDIRRRKWRLASCFRCVVGGGAAIDLRTLCNDFMFAQVVRVFESLFR